MTQETVERAKDTTFGIIFAAILIAVLLLVLAIVTGVLGSVNTSQYTSTYTVSNESGFINATSYSLANSGLTGFQNPVIITAANASNASAMTIITSGNYTISGAGKVLNATAIQYNTVVFNYTYQLGTSTSNLSNTLNSVQGNVFSAAINFFALMPTIGTILAVVVLIGVIVLLVLYVRRMAASNQTESGFNG